MIGHPRRYARVVALAGHAPERVLTNVELARIVDTSDDWIVARTGIRERRIAADDEATSDLVLGAARALIQRSNMPATDIDARALRCLATRWAPGGDVERRRARAAAGRLLARPRGGTR